MTEIIKPEESKEMTTAKVNAKQLCETALTLNVIDVESYDSAAEKRVALAHAKAHVETTFKPLIDKTMSVKREAESARKEAVQLLEKALSPFVVADNYLKQQRNVFFSEQERIRKEAERKAQAKAEEEARKERMKLAEASRKATEKAAELEAEGKKEAAAAMMEKAEEKEEQIEEVFTKTVNVEPVIERKTKLDNGTVYKITDLKITIPETPEEKRAGCRAVWDGIIPVGCIKFSSGDLKKWAKLEGKKNCKIYGITIEETVEERVRK